MKRFFAPLTMIVAAFAVVASIPSSADGQVFQRRSVQRHVERIPDPLPPPTLVVQPPAVAAQVEATAQKTGPIFNAVLRAKVRQELRSKHGYSFAESIRKANELDDNAISALIADAESLSGVKVVGTAIGDGKIIGAIIDFFNSPAGKMLLEMLMKLLLGALIHHDDPAGMWHTSLQAWNA